MSQAPLGVFDSGIGGLTVARRITQRLPHEALLYLGDTARVPWGNKSHETIQRYSLNIAFRLRDEGAKALVVACNTATAHALDVLEERLDLPVLGVVEPVARAAAQATRTSTLGVLGTRATVASGAYERALRRLDPGLRVLAQPCPLFVPLAEEGWTDGAVPREVARAYLRPFAGEPVDTLILGCTHYPLLASIIQEVAQDLLQRPVAVLDSAGATAEALATLLHEQRLLASSGDAPPAHRFWMTDLSSSFAEGWSRFFGAALTDVEHVDL